MSSIEDWILWLVIFNVIVSLIALALAFGRTKWTKESLEVQKKMLNESRKYWYGWKERAKDIRKQSHGKSKKPKVGDLFFDDVNKKAYRWIGNMWVWDVELTRRVLGE